MEKKDTCLTQPLFVYFGLFDGKGITFEDEAPFAHRTKVTFLCTLWSWANLYSVDNTNSLVNFLTWLGCR